MLQFRARNVAASTRLGLNKALPFLVDDSVSQSDAIFGIIDGRPIETEAKRFVFLGASDFANREPRPSESGIHCISLLI